MLVIRLFRVGKKNQPVFKIVVTDKMNPPRGGRFLEEIGFYNPLTKEKNLKKERIEYWISVGARPSSTVYNLLVQEKIVEGKKIPVHKKAKKKEEKKEEKPTPTEAPTDKEEKPSETKEKKAEEKPSTAETVEDKEKIEKPEEKPASDKPSEEVSLKEEPKEEKQTKQEISEPESGESTQDKPELPKEKE